MKKRAHFGSPNTRKTSQWFHLTCIWFFYDVIMLQHVMSLNMSQNSSTLNFKRVWKKKKNRNSDNYVNLLAVPPKFGMKVKLDSPVTQMRLDSKQIFVEAFDGFFLKDKVDPSSSVQHSHFNVRLLRLFCYYWGLGLTNLCRDRNQAV